MPTRTVRWLTALAAVAWIIVGACGLWEITVEDTGDDWETSYAIFSIALFLGTLLTVAAVVIVSHPAERSPWRTLGLGVAAVAVLSTMVAWALPLWMTLSAIGYGLLAAGSAPPWRRAVALLGSAQVLGLAALFVGIAMELGPQDEYGDHPAAFGLGTLVAALATLGALFQLDRAVVEDPGGAAIAGEPSDDQRVTTM